MINECFRRYNSTKISSLIWLQCSKLKYSIRNKYFQGTSLKIWPRIKWQPTNDKRRRHWQWMTISLKLSSVKLYAHVQVKSVRRGHLERNEIQMKFYSYNVITYILIIEWMQTSSIEWHSASLSRVNCSKIWFLLKRIWKDSTGISVNFDRLNSRKLSKFYIEIQFKRIKTKRMNLLEKYENSNQLLSYRIQS